MYIVYFVCIYLIYLLYVSLFAYHILYFTVPCCCFVHRHGKTLSSRINPIFFCSLHWRNLSSYNKITTTHFKQIRFWWKNVITFRGKVYSNFFKFVQQLFFLSVVNYWPILIYIYIYAFSRRFYPKRLTIQVIHLLSVCVFPGNWTHNRLHCC